MVPIMTSADIEKDPLMVFAEPYNTLILDGKGFKSSIPAIKSIAPKNNIKAWVDRKAFIHNLGHATASYYGYYLHPNAVYLYEILDDIKIFKFTKEVMQQSSDILITAYPGDFTSSGLDDHIDDLLNRFRNKALRDTIFRVGADLPRKLASDDRFGSPIHLAIQHGKPYDKILKAMSYGLNFQAKDEEGNFFPSDRAFLEALSKEFESTIIKNLAFDPVADNCIIKELKKQYKVLYRDFNVQPIDRKSYFEKTN